MTTIWRTMAAAWATTSSRSMRRRSIMSNANLPSRYFSRAGYWGSGTKWTV